MGGTLNPSQPLDATKFAFFKGINDDGNGNGLLKATVTGGLPAGMYRVCTLTGASNHQPVLMPVAQRGAQDDCQKFTVGQGGGKTSNNNNNAASNANQGQTGQVQTGQGQRGQNGQGQNGQGQQQQQQAQQARSGQGGRQAQDQDQRERAAGRASSGFSNFGRRSKSSRFTNRSSIV
ncbi:hypothetical protein LTS18_006325 [Coniosporium uncinatum]|uniref:Uncharacterized protein n=1 Tax=Coniosporium uncinatum TaxID=93489 RepID=A0ACC3DQE8_9PEZI|nr:hypothetical protein LTS18_006325 [Coniosporium uncinatum]